jgi:hypothetical protein
VLMHWCCVGTRCGGGAGVCVGGWGCGLLVLFVMGAHRTTSLPFGALFTENRDRRQKVGVEIWRPLESKFDSVSRITNESLWCCFWFQVPTDWVLKEQVLCCIRVTR